MRAQIPVVIAAACVAIFVSCSWVPPNLEPTFPVDYPIPHYFQSSDSGSFALWKMEVRAFRRRLTLQYGTPGAASAVPLSESREEEFLDQAVDPARVLWKDPTLFWKTPVLLSWWEVIDEGGKVARVYVIASNQSKGMDRKILAYCVNDKLWKPAEIDGNPVVSIRSASINLGESKYHIAYWEKKISEDKLTVTVVVVIAAAVLWLRHLARKRERERLDRARHAHIHHYRPHEHDIEPPL